MRPDAGAPPATPKPASRPEPAAAADPGGDNGPGGTPRLGGEQRQRLEAEREFLLVSLRDLRVEREAGELPDDRYEALVTRYTARAARIVRVLDADADADAAVDGVDPLGPGPRDGPATPRWRRRMVVAGPLLAVAVLGGVLLATTISGRQPGQTVTGNEQTSRGTRTGLERAVERNPDDAAAHRALARTLLDEGDMVGALRHYDETARLDATDAEARAYAGWIVALAGLYDDALQRLDTAVAANPDYPDAHFFRGMVLLRGRDDSAGAAAELQRFLELAPDSPLRGQVEEVLASLPGPTPPPG